MAKLGELNWNEPLEKTDEYTHEPTALWAADMHGGGKQGVDPLNKSKKILEPGEIPTPQSNEEIAEYILRGAPKQPTDEQMFGGGAVTEEEAQERLAKWEGIFNGHFEQLNKNIEDPNSEDNKSWGSGKSFNETLTEAERIKRNMYTKD